MNLDELENTGPYFVMLLTQRDSYTPMMAGDDIARYETHDDAVDGAADNILAMHFGFVVFCMEDGDVH